MAATEGWVIEMLPSGQVDLRRDRRPVGYDLDMDEALDWLRRRDKDAREVTVIELDGYRVKQRV